MTETTAFKVLQPGEGASIKMGPLFGVDFKFFSEDTGGLVSVVEHPFEPGALVPPHMHTREDEYSIVIAGEISFRSGVREVVLGPGGYITKPRGELHTMWNAAAVPGRIIEIITPGGFEHFFREAGELFNSPGGPPAPVDIVALGARYGLSYDNTWVPDLVAEHGLRLLVDEGASSTR